MAQNVLNAIQGTSVPGGGYVYDEQTSRQITYALNNNTALAAAAQTAAATANAAVATLSSSVDNTNANNYQTITGIQQQIGALPTTFVTSITLNPPGFDATGDLAFQGSNVIEDAGTQFNFTTFGYPTFVTRPAVPNWGTVFFIVYDPSGAGHTLTLPSVASQQLGTTIRIHTASTTDSFNVVPFAGDVFNSNGGTSYTINPLGSTAYIGAMFTCVTQGANTIWITAGYN